MYKNDNKGREERRGKEEKKKIKNKLFPEDWDQNHAPSPNN